MGNHNKDQDTKEKPKPSKFSISPGIINYLIIGFFIFALILYFNKSGNSKKIDWKDFATLVIETKVDKVVIVNNETAEVYIRKKPEKKKSFFNGIQKNQPSYILSIGSPEVFENKLHRLQGNIPLQSQVNVTYEARENWFTTVLIWVLPFIFMFILWRWIRSRMLKSSGGPGGGSKMFSFGETGAKLLEKDNKANVSFDDVAGMNEVKEEMYETVDFLKKPENYTALGAKVPKGILLIGPPGTGKTLLARAIAGEAQVPFYSLSGSEFVEMFVGVGASRVRDLFKKAKEKAPCIIFIDELDAIGRARGKSASAFGGNDERESTLNQMLTEMDGFSPNSGVIVLAATNRGDMLDQALLRPGRFDRHIHLELPDNKERKAIFELHMKNLKLAEEINAKTLAMQTPGFSGADIANACNEAVLIAVRNKKNAIEKDDFSQALDRIVGGLEKKNKVVSNTERKIVAYHEAGHALATCLLKGVKGVVKVSIIPRGKSLGSTWNKPEEMQLIKLQQIKNEMGILLAGRAAEQIMFNETTTGALDDLEKVSKQAYSLVAYYGLGKKIGNVSYYDSSGQQESSFHKPYSEETARLIDQEVQSLVAECYQKILALFEKYKGELTQIGDLLLEKEVINKSDLEQIIKNIKEPLPLDHINRS
jgi:AFG3 family protein